MPVLLAVPAAFVVVVVVVWIVKLDVDRSCISASCSSSSESCVAVNNSAKLGSLGHKCLTLVAGAAC